MGEHGGSVYTGSEQQNEWRRSLTAMSKSIRDKQEAEQKLRPQGPVDFPLLHCFPTFFFFFFKLNLGLKRINYKNILHTAPTQREAFTSGETR